MGWTFVYLFVFLKLPICAALWIVWWASRPPEPAAEEPVRSSQPGPLSPHGRRRPLHPRPRRRGPHGGGGAAVLPAPARVRLASARARRTPAGHR